MARKQRKKRVLEKEIESAVCNWAKKQGFLALKFTPSGDVGWPDRIFISPTGQHVWMEFKRPGTEPRPMQHFRMEELRNHRCVAHWFDDADEAINLLELYL